jgi:predicted DCC family thiol-disulfide oxidoreductase YuxK
LPSSKSWPSSEPALILFDGVCNLCNATVRFIIARDPRARFRFAPLQSDAASERLERAGGAPAGQASVVLIENGRLYTRSAAALRIARALRFPWPMLYGLIVIPRPIRDRAYEFVARRRYRWFGRSQACGLPTPELRDRFLTVDTPKPGQLR